MDECLLVFWFQNESSCETLKKSEFDWHENGPLGKSIMNGFLLRLVLTQRQKTILGRPIG